MVWSDKPVYIYKKRGAEEMINFPNNAEFEKTKKLELLDFVSKFILEKNAVFVINFE